MISIMNNVANKEKRRLLRKNQTPEEVILWKFLRRNHTGVKWRRQVSIGAYVADFYCGSQKLVIEVDGIQHEQALEYDQIRDTFFKSLGIRVLRIKNKEFNSDLEKIYQKIMKAVTC